MLQGRALLNAVGNLELKDAYAEALTKLGYTLENVIEKVCCVVFFLKLNIFTVILH